MSKLAELRQLEQSLAVQLEAIEALKRDAGLKQEVEFERRLRELLENYDKQLGDIVELYDQTSSRTSALVVLLQKPSAVHEWSNSIKIPITMRLSKPKAEITKCLSTGKPNTGLALSRAGL